MDSGPEHCKYYIKLNINMEEEFICTTTLANKLFFL